MFLLERGVDYKGCGTKCGCHGKLITCVEHC